MIACNWPRLEPFTEDSTREVMRVWLMEGFNSWQPNGRMQLIQVGNPVLDLYAQRMVLGGFGLRIAGGIELNDAGLALWQETHPA